MTYRARCEGRRRRNKQRKSEFMGRMAAGFALLQSPWPFNYVVDPMTKASVPAKSIEEWAAFMNDTAARTVGRTQVGHMEVSTVHLGLDHGRGRGQQVCFETMIFTKEDGAMPYQRRYSTWDEALSGHAAAIAWAHQHLAATRAN